MIEAVRENQNSELWTVKPKKEKRGKLKEATSANSLITIKTIVDYIGFYCLFIENE